MMLCNNFTDQRVSLGLNKSESRGGNALGVVIDLVDNNSNPIILCLCKTFIRKPSVLYIPAHSTKTES